MSKINVLVADDELADREVCADVIEQLNYDVTTAESARAALKILETSNFEIVISDLSMEKKTSGLELLKEIKKKYPDTQVILMTAYGSIETAVEALKFGAFDYVTKPLNMQKLSILIQRCKASLKLHREQKILKQQLFKKTQKLNQIQESLIETEKMATAGKLSAGIAHQLRNPLFSIRATLEYCIDKSDLPSDVLENLEICIKNIDLANSVINDLLKFSRQNKEYKFEKNNINTLMETTFNLLKGRCSKQKIVLKKSYDKNLPLISIDENNLKQAILNILANSLDSMPDGGSLTITTHNSRSKKFVIIRICDTGYGISDEDKKNIFKPFYAGKPGGVGLGLAISKDIVEHHQGKINLESKLNEGTEVEIQLPVSR